MMSGTTVKAMMCDFKKYEILRANSVFFIRKYGFFFGLALLLIIVLTLFSNTVVVREALSFFESAVEEGTTPFKYAFQYSISSIENIYSEYMNLRSAKKELIQKVHENMILKNKLSAMYDLEEENARLRQIAHFKERHPFEFLSCIFYESDPSFIYKNARVNKGSKDGVKLGMGVVSADGVVGVIMNTAAHHSSVLLLTDPNSNFDVIVARNHRRGILEGGFENTMQFKYFDHGDRLLLGDEIVTSGLTGPFPAGILIGKVKKINFDKNSVSEIIEVEPAVNFEKVKEALILKTVNRELEVIKQVGGEEWIHKVVHSGTTHNGT